MKEAAFTRKNVDKWKEMESPVKKNPDELASQLIELTDDLSYARTFYSGSKTESYLNQLASHKFMKLYKNRKLNRNRFLKFWGMEIPLLISEHKNKIRLALLIFLVGMFVGVISAIFDDTYVRLILTDSYVNQTIENIEKGDPMAIYKGGSASYFFLAITLNNIKVAFFAFVLGFFLSIGSSWIMFSNGVMLGAFQYFFFQKGLFVTSVLSIWIHGTFEITSIIIAGGAGIILGNSILFPKSYPRMHSLKKGAVDGIKIITSLVPIFIIAGFLESFVTRHTDMNPAISISIILISLAIVIFYFIMLPRDLSGRLNKQ